MYNPEATATGSFMARNSIDIGDSAARDKVAQIARTSALSINFPSGASN